MVWLFKLAYQQHKIRNENAEQKNERIFWNWKNIQWFLWAIQNGEEYAWE